VGSQPDILPELSRAPKAFLFKAWRGRLLRMGRNSWSRFILRVGLPATTRFSLAKSPASNSSALSKRADSWDCRTPLIAYATFRVFPNLE